MPRSPIHPFSTIIAIPLPTLFAGITALRRDWDAHTGAVPGRTPLLRWHSAPNGAARAPAGGPARFWRSPGSAPRHINFTTLARR